MAPRIWCPCPGVVTPLARFVPTTVAVCAVVVLALISGDVCCPEFSSGQHRYRS